MANPTDNTGKLDDLLKRHAGEGFDVLAEALKEVAKEEGEERKKKAKEQIRKAMDLKRQMDEAERQFNSQKKKWDKELGKTLARLNNMAIGRPVDEGVNDKEDQKEGEQVAQ
jgi:nitric oxide reductase activation protein